MQVDVDWVAVNNHFYIGFEPVDRSFTESSKWFPAAAGMEFFNNSSHGQHHGALQMDMHYVMYMYVQCIYIYILYINLFSKDYKSITTQNRAEPTIKANH